MAQSSIQHPTFFDLRGGSAECSLTYDQLMRTTAFRLGNTFSRTMSFTPPYRFISAPELAELVKKSDTQEVQVVDVRDDDFVG